MARGEQIDKLSKRYIKLSVEGIRFEKRKHKRYLRRLRKDITKPNPLCNRYNGWVG